MTFALEETLVNPTVSSVTLGLVPEQDADLLVRYGVDLSAPGDETNGSTIRERTIGRA